MSRCDICVVDLDQCLFPGFTHTRLGQFLFLRACLSPRHWGLLGRFVAGGWFITWTRLRELGGRRAPNELLMAAFDRNMRGMPLAWIESVARWLPRLAYAGWRETLGLVARRMPVCLLSFAIEPITTTFGRCRDRRGRRIFTRTFGNPIETDDGRIASCWSEVNRYRPEDKRELLLRWMDELGARRPLVIGHSADEAPLADVAREAGGLSIGANPDATVADRFDVVVHQWTWWPLYRRLKRLLAT